MTVLSELKEIDSTLNNRSFELKEIDSTLNGRSFGAERNSFSFE
jgi:hypothetical protein